MENQFENLKENLSKGELADFVFTEQMRMNVLEKTGGRAANRKKTDIKISNAVPKTLSMAAVLILSVGIYSIVSNGLQKHANPAPNPGRNADYDIILPQPGKDTEVVQKPKLVNPSYIPEGYVYKQTLTNDNLYKHIYVKETNEKEYFSYGMQTGEPELSEEGTELDLAEGVTGHVYKISEDTKVLIWQDEGFYQSVEQVGDMSEIDFYKVASSILKAKGHTVLLDQHINELEEAKKAKEEAQKIEEEKKARLAFDEGKAVALLEKFKTTTDAAFADSYNNQEKFNSYKTKEDFYAAFTDFMASEIIDSTFNFRIEERDDGLYNLPTEAPHYLWTDTPYDFEKVSDTEYKIIQYQESDLHGKQNIIFQFKYEADKWIIQDIQVIQVIQQ